MKKNGIIHQGIVNIISVAKTGNAGEHPTAATPYTLNRQAYICRFFNTAVKAKAEKLRVCTMPQQAMTNRQL